MMETTTTRKQFPVAAPEGNGGCGDIMAGYVNIRLVLLVGLLMVLPTPTRGQPGWLNATNLGFFSTDPVPVNWPIVFAATYADPSLDVNRMVLVWAFEGAPPDCTIRGRPGTNPCRGRVMEKTWRTPGIHAVTLTASLPGQPPIAVTKHVTVALDYGGNPQAVRQEIRTLPLARWNQTIQALYYLKDLGVYDHFVYLHQIAAVNGIRAGSQRNAAHRGPSFLPWHRAYIKHFERTLQAAANDMTLGLAFWDWAFDQGLRGGPRTSSLWTDTYFGPSGTAANNYAVPSGPFCSVRSRTCAGRWRLLPQLGGPNLERELGRVANNLPSAYNVNNIRSVNTYDVSPYDEFVPAARSFRVAMEGFGGGNFYGPGHNGVHNFVGGSMGPVNSPNDPVFWAHHCNVDRIWYLWQVQHNCWGACYRPQARDNSITRFTPGSVFMNGEYRLPGHHFNDAMYPWFIRPADVADANNSLLDYVYQ